jgi:hypothetical protein
MRKFTKLESLALENVLLTDSILSSLSCFKTLTTLRLVCCEKITPAALEKVYAQTELTTLKLESCILIDGVGTLPRSLKRLGLVNLASVSAEEVTLGLSGCDTLSYLDLSMNEWLTDASLKVPAPLLNQNRKSL